MLPGGIHLLTAEEMQRLDGYTIETIGIPGAVLMENAGRAVVDSFESHFDIQADYRVAIFCGKGNNGGDGFVIARHLQQCGHEAVVYLFCTLDQLSGDALLNAGIAERVGIDIIEVADAEALSEVQFNPTDYAFIFDALFGTGLNSAVRGHYLGAIDLINSSGLPVIAVDVPSGISSDTGVLPGPSVRADLTVTFAYPKRGLILPPACKQAGEVVVADISIPLLAEGDELNTVLISETMIQHLNLEREIDSHKGTFGHVGILAGSPGKAGAAALTGSACLASGSGLATVLSSADVTTTIPAVCAELMTESLSCDSLGFASSAVQEALNYAANYSALAVGPGLGTSEATIAMIRDVVRKSPIPVVLDADGINAFAGEAALLSTSESKVIITPHPGEMARLLGIETSEVVENRIEIARQCAVEQQIIVVLKGARTVTADSTGDVYINTTGNPGMATAGSGDVLTGIIASLVGRDFTALEAAVAGVYLHGLAGDLARQEVGMASMTASTLLEYLPHAFRSFEEA